MSREPAKDGWEEVEMPDEDGVRIKLAELGVPLAAPQRAVFVGQQAGDFCTAAHPVFYAGSRVYGETNGTLRLELGAAGWTFNDDNNIPRVLSPDGSVVITALAGDSRTGLRYSGDVQTRRPRRTGSLRIIKQNNQYIMESLFGPDDPDANSEVPSDIGPTWFLLYHRDGDVIRSELSLAKGVKDGRLLEWLERLVLPEIDMLSGPPDPGADRPDDGEPDIDVPVVPRAG